MATTRINGELQIDHERGVIYFHSAETGWCVLRMSGLPRPIPDVSQRQLDITHMIGTDWGEITSQEMDDGCKRTGYAIAKQILARLDKAERTARAAANTASCLANGILPD